MNNIMLIEDDKQLRQNIRIALERSGFQVDEFSNGSEVFVKKLDSTPDLILCDIMMPEKDGYWVFNEIKKHHTLSTIPFIFITAKVDRDDIRKGMNLGADDYLTKPFKISELLDAVNSRISLHKGNAPYSKLKPKPQETLLKIDNFILLDVGKKLERIAIKSIDFIKADGVYSEVYMNNTPKIEVRKSLNDWEHILPNESFIRIHRSTIINILAVSHVEKWFNQTLLLYIQNYKEPLKISRSYKSALKGKIIF
ncbi:MAG: response regulator [Bacteroidetes bacterium]|nr:response regulator [Bacteroidota bacterium]